MELLKNTKVWIGIGILVVLVGGGFGVYRYIQLTNELKKVQVAQTNPIAAEEVKRIVEKVGKLMELPAGEEPTVATVTDVDKLRDQPFFQRAQNDDKVLIFTSEKRAILYRPGTNKIIDVAPVNLSQSTATPEAATNTIAGATVALYNGTTVAGLVRQYESEIRAKTPTLTVTARENAVNQNTRGTVLIDVTGNKTTEARSLARSLGIQTGVMPSGEKAPAADFLIIVGNDKVAGAVTPSVSPKPTVAQ